MGNRPCAGSTLRRFQPALAAPHLRSDEAHMEAELWPGSHNELIIRSNADVVGRALRTTSLVIQRLLDAASGEEAPRFGPGSASSRGSDRFATVRPGLAVEIQESKIFGEFVRIAASFMVPNWERSPGRKRRKIAGPRVPRRL